MSCAIIAAVLCVGECALLRLVPEAAEHYVFYVGFMLAASAGGGLLLSVICGRMSGARSEEAVILRARVAELERDIDALSDSAESRERFVASFAHELKTPLTAIIGYADMLRSKEMAPKTRFTAAGYIFSEGKRLEALSLKLMDIIVAGKSEFERKNYDAGSLIREVAAVAVPSTGGDGLALNIRWDKGAVRVEPDLFKTLLLNLVDNARKASRRGQEVELYGRQEQGGYAFYVKDSGRGMKREELAHITEPFYMIDKSRARSQNGAGLGLALCKKIAELHDTQLEYASEPGQGTTVRIFLPQEVPANG